MYWPIGTPSIYATTSNSSPNFRFLVSHDGLQSPPQTDPRSPPLPTSPFHQSSSTAPPEDGELHPLPTPITPLTPRIAPVEHGDDESRSSEESSTNVNVPSIPVKDPILALRVSRAGHLFVVITKKSITIWQTKVCPNLSSHACSIHAILTELNLAHGNPRARRSIRIIPRTLRR
jgi:RAB6A-GEF complex partner protein 1